MVEESNDSRESPSPQVLENLKDVLGEKYDYAISVVTWGCENLISTSAYIISILVFMHPLFIIQGQSRSSRSGYVF